MPRCRGATQEIGVCVPPCTRACVVTSRSAYLRCSASLIQQSPNWNGEVLVDGHPRGVARVSSLSPGLSVGGDSPPLRAEEEEAEVCACRYSMYVCM